MNGLPPDILKHIPASLHSNVVDRLKCFARTSTAELAYEELNFRYVFKQLGLELAETDQRELWYVVLQRMGGKMDLGSKTEQMYNSFANNILGGFYERLSEHLNLGYWALAQEYLGVVSKARAILYDLDGNSFLLDIKTIKDFYDTPFFLIIAEKDIVIKGIMRDLSDRGYKHGFYGIVTGGYSSTSVVRMLMHLQPVSDRFYVFVAHDLDVDGLKILLDLKQYFNCESIGVNPDLLARCGVPFASLSQTYGSGGSATQKQIAGFHTMLKNAKLSREENKCFKDWLSACKDFRAELNALTAVRERADPFMSKVRDLVDEIERLLIGRVFDLNRYREPKYPDSHDLDSVELEVEPPDEFETMAEVIKKRAVSLVKEILGCYELDDNDGWNKIVEKKLEKYLKENDETRNLIPHTVDIWKDKFIEKNSSFSESLKMADDVLANQDTFLGKDFDILWKSYAKRVDEQKEDVYIDIRNDQKYKDVLARVKRYDEIMNAKFDEAKKQLLIEFPDLANPSKKTKEETDSEDSETDLPKNAVKENSNSSVVKRESVTSNEIIEKKQDMQEILNAAELKTQKEAKYREMFSKSKGDNEKKHQSKPFVKYKCPVCHGTRTEEVDTPVLEAPSMQSMQQGTIWDSEHFLYILPDGMKYPAYISKICNSCDAKNKKNTINDEKDLESNESNE